MSKWTKEQLEAIETDGTSIIVSAGAGSGKTAVLTERVINKLKQGVHINELLILTFTHAAADEMKSRIRSSIKKNDALKKELESIDSAYITTFDSYALSVLKKYHYLLNISNNISVVDTTLISLEKKRIMHEVFSELYEFEDVSFEDMINTFCVKDDIEIEKSLLDMSSKLDMIYSKTEYLNNYIKSYYNPLNYASIIDKFNNLIKVRKEALIESLEELKSISDAEYYYSLEDSIKGIIESNNISDLILNVNYKLPSLKRGSSLLEKRAKESVSDSLKKLMELTHYGTEENIVKSIIDTKKTTAVIIKILKLYFEKLDKYKAENELYEFNDIAQLSIKILNDYPSVREETKNSFKEIMIDEYQDTNDIQELFINLISTNNTYMVGDIKQSIYRFRNANPDIFKQKYEQYSKLENGIKIDLLKNFRSRDIVLGDINNIFNLIMDLNIGGAEYKESHAMIFGNNTYLEEGKTNQDYNTSILEYNYRDIENYTKDEIEIFSIARDIKNKINDKYQVFDKDLKVLRNVEYKDFSILMDRATNFDLYKKIFEYEGIPLTMYKDEKLNEGIDLGLIKNIIDILIRIHNNDLKKEFKYDFISIARSFLYCMSDEEILGVFNDESYKDTKIWKDLYEISVKINSLTNHEIIELILKNTSYYELLITIGDIEASMIRIQKLIELADSLKQLGYDIYDFRDYLKEILEQKYEIKYSLGVDNSNSVKIMTIHKSKGLEYHICYYSGLYKSFNIQELNDKFIYDNKLGFIVPYFEEGINQTVLKEILKENYIKEEISERIRLFYVALTRSKEKMILLTPYQEEEKLSKTDTGCINDLARIRYRSFSDILVSIKEYLPNYFNQIDVNSIGLSKDYLFVKDIKLNKENTDQIIEVSEINVQNKELTDSHYSKTVHGLITKETKNNMDFGIKIHEILELIDFKNYDSKLIEDDFIRNKVEAFLSNPILKDISKANIYKEYEFVIDTENGQSHGIIDLMLEYSDHIDIIDYKLKNVTDSNYLLQVQGYKNYIELITNKKVNTYLYSIIDCQLKIIESATDNW